MLEVREAINFVWKLSVGMELLVAARLLWQGLGGEYPALLAACLILPFKSLLLMFSYGSLMTRSQLRTVSEQLSPLEWVVSAWIVYELFSMWTKRYQGIGRFGKWLLSSLLVLAIVISIACFQREWESLVFARNFRIYYIVNRFAWVTLAVFVTGTWLFFRSFPVAIAPNVVRHTYVAVIYFTANAILQLAFTLTGRAAIVWVNLSLVSITALSFAAWAALLTRKAQATPPDERVSRGDRDRIDRLNHELLVFMESFPKHDR